MQAPTRALMRRGRMRIGRRMRRARSVDRHIVPKSVVVAWLRAAVMTCREVGAGTLRR